MRLLIVTQVQENYGAHAWNGEGECPQYWKCKGGNEYIAEVPDALLSADRDTKRAFESAACAKVPCEDNDYWREYIISVAYLAPGELSESEKQWADPEWHAMFPNGKCPYEPFKRLEF